MHSVEPWVAVTEVAGFSICVFAFTLCVAQLHRMAAYALLACLFLMLMLSDLFDVASGLMLDLGQVALVQVFAVSYVSSFLIPPALLLYVRALVGQPIVGDRNEAFAHLALPGIATAIGIALINLASQGGAEAVIAPDGAEASATGKLSLGVMVVLPLAFYVQCLVYVALTMRAQFRHREKLRDLFASTEPYELRWITGMALLFGGFAVLNLLSLVSAAMGYTLRLPAIADSALELLIVMALGVWGLRQSPGLAEISIQAASHEEMTHIKYEKSALDPERAERIAGKLQTAMARDEVYRDANLSLTGLSQHIGVTTNYVSQTLNAYLGISFFDFVNEWRVSAAKPMIAEGAQPITLIAYEVGFNSRSSFYTAFNKNVGMTPSEYHKEAQSRIPETN